MTTFPAGPTFTTEPDGLISLYRQLPLGAVTVLRVHDGVEDWPCAVAGLTAAASSAGTVVVTDLNIHTKMGTFEDAAGSRLVVNATNGADQVDHIFRTCDDGETAAQALRQLLMPATPSGNRAGVDRAQPDLPGPATRLALQLVDGIEANQAASGSCSADAAGDTPEWCPRLSTAAEIASTLRDYAALAPTSPTVVLAAGLTLFGTRGCERHKVYGDYLGTAIENVALGELSTTQDERRGFAVTRAFRETTSQKWTRSARHRIATLDRDTFDFAAYLDTGEDHYLSMGD